MRKGRELPNVMEPQKKCEQDKGNLEKKEEEKKSEEWEENMSNQRSTLG